jgi:hypothetical protein
MSSVVQQPCSCQIIIHTRNKHTKILQCEHFRVHDNHSATQARKYCYSGQLKPQRFKLHTAFFITSLKLDNITAVEKMMPLPTLQCSVQQLKKTPCSRSFDKTKACTHKTMLLQHHSTNPVKQAYTANCNSASTFYCTVTLLLRSQCHMSDIIPMRGHVRYLHKKCLCTKIKKRLLCKH